MFDVIESDRIGNSPFTKEFLKKELSYWVSIPLSITPENSFSVFRTADCSAHFPIDITSGDFSNMSQIESSTAIGSVLVCN